MGQCSSAYRANFSWYYYASAICDIIERYAAGPSHTRYGTKTTHTSSHADAIQTNDSGAWLMLAFRLTFIFLSFVWFGDGWMAERCCDETSSTKSIVARGRRYSMHMLSMVWNLRAFLCALCQLGLLLCNCVSGTAYRYRIRGGSGNDGLAFEYILPQHTWAMSSEQFL